MTYLIGTKILDGTHTPSLIRIYKEQNLCFGGSTVYTWDNDLQSSEISFMEYSLKRIQESTAFVFRYQLRILLFSEDFNW